MDAIFDYPSALLLALVYFRKEFLNSSGTPNFAAPSLETTLYLLNLVASRDYAHSLIALRIFPYFKSSFLSVWIPACLNLSADSDPPNWDTDRFCCCCCSGAKSYPTP